VSDLSGHVALLIVHIAYADSLVELSFLSSERRVYQNSPCQQAWTFFFFSLDALRPRLSNGEKIKSALLRCAIKVAGGDIAGGSGVVKDCPVNRA